MKNKILILYIILFSSTCFAENYYWVKGSGSKTSGSTTNSSLGCSETLDNYYGSISGAIGQMSGGEWVMVCDGTYSSARISISGKDGSSGNQTVIRAVNDWGVQINSSDGSYAIESGDDYITIRGFHLSGGGVYLVGANYNRVIRVSADQGGTTGGTFLAGSDSNYNVIEECFAYDGPHRYMFYPDATSDYNIYRKNLGRWDYTTSNQPIAIFNSYDCLNTEFYNNIAIDSTDTSEGNAQFDGLKAFFTANGSHDVVIKGCVALNLDGVGGIWIEDSPVDAIIEDVVIWDINDNWAYDDAYDGSDNYVEWAIRYEADSSGTTSVNRATIGGSDFSTRSIDAVYDPGSSVTTSLKNSIFYNITLDNDYSLNGVDTEGYNDYNSNTSDYNGSPSNGQTYDPTSNGLKYLIRIENGSNLKTDGESGGQIGAEIRYQYGTVASTAMELDYIGALDSSEADNLSGKYYGESGYNTLTSVKLWPYSYEQEACEKAGAISHSANALWTGSPAISGDRGFASDYPSCTSISLSKYVMNYLSPSPAITSQNDIDTYIYGESASTPVYSGQGVSGGGSLQ